MHGFEASGKGCMEDIIFAGLLVVLHRRINLNIGKRRRPIETVWWMKRVRSVEVDIAAEETEARILVSDWGCR
jgi:hypothetical protein